MEKIIQHPAYKGQGNHSVRQLEALCEAFNEYCYQESLKKNALVDALQAAEKLLLYYAPDEKDIHSTSERAAFDRVFDQIHHALHANDYPTTNNL